MTKERRVRGLHIAFIYCQLSFGKYKVSKERLSRKEKGENSRKWKKIKQEIGKGDSIKGVELPDAHISGESAGVLIHARGYERQRTR